MSFVGREREVADVQQLLGEKRLITLAEPGGCGKTRLALATAFEVVDGFEEGVWWRELAQLSEPDLVPRAVASVLNVRAAPGRSPIGALADHLQTSRTLLVLDNCGHLIEACAVLAEMLLRPARTCVSLPHAVKLWALLLATLLLSRKGPWSVASTCSTDYDPAVVWLWRKVTLPNRYRQLVRGTREAIRALAAGCVGNFVEWHDSVIYLYSVPIIASLFFPSGNRTATILVAFALWGVAFVARPPMRMRSWSPQRER